MSLRLDVGTTKETVMTCAEYRDGGLQTVVLSQLDELRRDLITISYDSLGSVHIAQVACWGLSCCQLHCSVVQHSNPALDGKSWLCYH